MQNNERTDSRECVVSQRIIISVQSQITTENSFLKYTHSHIKVEKTLRRRTIAAATECVPLCFAHTYIPTKVIRSG